MMETNHAKTFYIMHEIPSVCLARTLLFHEACKSIMLKYNLLDFMYIKSWWNLS